MPRTARRGLVGAFAVGAAVAFAACGHSETKTIETAQVEHELQQAILHHSGIPATVKCPTSGIKREVGFDFICAAQLEAGTYPLAVTVTSDNGEVRFVNHEPFVALNTTKVEGAIVAAVAKQRGLKADVHCPRYVLQRQGVTFTCTATVNGRDYPFTVTQTNNSGHVTYEGH